MMDSGSTSATTTTTTTSPQGGVGAQGGGESLAWFLLASLLVIGLAIYVTRWLARWQFVQGKGRRMRVLEGMAIGKDRQLLLVQVGKEVLVLGSSEGGVNLVHRVEDPAQVEEWLQDPSPDRAPTPSFSGMESSIRANLDRMRSLLTKNGGRTNA
ncbi:MAG: FliO/MopB family protein [Bacillota bacterium]